jgi:hypothetical protein
MHALSHAGSENNYVHRQLIEMMQNFSTRLHGGFAGKLSIFLIALMLIGCSAARLGYRNAEFLSYWWLNGYVDVEPEQTTWVKQRIAGIFAWQRKTQLKPYIQLLAQQQKRVQGQVTEAELLADYEQVKKRLLVMVDRVLPDMADLALALQPQQIVAIEKKFAKTNNEYRKDYLRGDQESRQRFRYKKALKQAEEWFGGYNSEQERLIRAASDARPLNNELVLASRIHAQKVVIELLKKIQAERPSREVATAMMREAVTAWLDRFGNPEHKAYFDSYITGTARMTVVMYNIATPSQRSHFVRSAQQWIDDFEVLSSQ